MNRVVAACKKSARTGRPVSLAEPTVQEVNLLRALSYDSDDGCDPIGVEFTRYYGGEDERPWEVWAEN